VENLQFQIICCLFGGYFLFSSGIRSAGLLRSAEEKVRYRSKMIDFFGVNLPFWIDPVLSISCDELGRAH